MEKQQNTTPQQELANVITGNYRATAVGLNVASAFILPRLLVENIDIAKLHPVSQFLLANSVLTSMGLDNLLLHPLFTGYFRRSNEEKKNIMEVAFGDYRDRTSRSGTQLQSDYLAAKVMGTQPQHRWKRAARISAVSHALRQNTFVQAATYTPLVIATGLDMLGYVAQGIAGPRWRKESFFLRNATQALLVDYGLIAPSENDMDKIIENTRLRFKAGRMAFEQQRFAEKRAASWAHKSPR